MDYSMSMSRYLLQGHAVFGGMIDRPGQRGDKAFCPTWEITCEALSHTSQYASNGVDPMVAHPRPLGLDTRRRTGYGSTVQRCYELGNAWRDFVHSC